MSGLTHDPSGQACRRLYAVGTFWKETLLMSGKESVGSMAVLENSERQLWVESTILRRSGAMSVVRLGTDVRPSATENLAPQRPFCCDGCYLEN